jgi:hypothetical protein
MERQGVFAPKTAQAARERYESLSTAAQGVVREVTRAMAFDTTEYDERVTPDVIESAQEAMFASLLEVQIASQDEFDSWRDSADFEIEELGSEHVDNVVWHAPPFADIAVAATFQDETEAAVDTLRRQAFGRLYADILRDGETS